MIYYIIAKHVFIKAFLNALHSLSPLSRVAHFLWRTLDLLYSLVTFGDSFIHGSRREREAAAAHYERSAQVVREGKRIKRSFRGGGRKARRIEQLVLVFSSFSNPCPK